MKSAVITVVSCLWVLCLASCSSTRRSLTPVTSADPYKAEPSVATTFAWPEGKRAAVCLTFDDARPSQADVGIPILNAAGVKATFYVTPSRVPERLAAWKDAVRAGHEIGNHSVRHPCTGNFAFARQKALEDYTLAQMAEELDQASAQIRQMLGVHPVTFAYPCGQKYVGRGRDVESYVPLVAERFLAGRGWRDEGTNDPTFCDPAQLMTIELDGLTFEQVKALAEDAAKNGTWLVFCGHEIGSGGRQTVLAETLRAFCEYAQDPRNGIWVDTVTNVTRYVMAQRDHTGQARAR